MSTLPPERVIPAQLRAVVEPLPYWFVIGGQAVRCFCPYRPSQDVDFGVSNAKDIDALLAQLSRNGDTEIIERSGDTVHLVWNRIKVSIFLLETLAPFTTERRLSVTGILATKLHAILDRGARRDFFDLYVTLEHHRLGLAECLSALREVYRQPVKDALLLRALTYFDDAEREAPIPGEGPDDWKTVKGFFLERAGQLLVPPLRPLVIQARRVDVQEH
ncbi:MAG: nucleotidyl transferase AbiEii/AbiGii toxin family protein [Deltaproteobacteria bacterium]|nr:nucleotidyl transferase AbiEii/AbiGii toxin family protein [Deltaproteobacteria bacterium]